MTAEEKAARDILRVMKKMDAQLDGAVMLAMMDPDHITFAIPAQPIDGGTENWEMVEHPVGGFAEREGRYAHRNCPGVDDQWHRTRVDGEYGGLPPKAKFCPDCGQPMT